MLSANDLLTSAPVRRSPVRLIVGLALAIATATSAILVGQSPTAGGPAVAFVRVASPEQRMKYLSTAQIWADPGILTPAALVAGPPLEDGSGVEAALDGRPFPCTYDGPGKEMGGNTRKFSCATTAGKTIRLKYSDEKKVNREVFAAVAASRLLWALGFMSDPIYPITIDCLDCPEDPMSGKGSKAKRTYLAIYQPEFTEVVMVASSEQNQGWRWGELNRAIDSLPAGELRSRQRQHFDALMLVGVLLQHGDRKPQQQRLACRGPLTPEAGDIRPVDDDDANGPSVFVERSGATACSSPAVTVQDVGATFGGAGRTTNASTAKMNLKSWMERPVFDPASKDDGVSECHGKITVSMASGEESLGNPRIGEAGRLFLLERLRHLTDDHLRAILTAARVERLNEEQSWRDPDSATVNKGIDAWIAAFKHKVKQIEARTCAA